MIISDRKITTTKSSDTKIIISSSTTIKEQYYYDVNLQERADIDLLDPVEDTNTSVEKSSPQEEKDSLLEAVVKDKKQQIIEHLKQTSDNFLYYSVDNNKRNSKIREHIKNSLS